MSIFCLLKEGSENNNEYGMDKKYMEKMQSSDETRN